MSVCRPKYNRLRVDPSYSRLCTTSTSSKVHPNIGTALALQQLPKRALGVHFGEHAYGGSPVGHEHDSFVEVQNVLDTA